MMSARSCKHRRCASSRKFPTMCLYLLQTSIAAVACSVWGCGLSYGGQRCGPGGEAVMSISML